MTNINDSETLANIETMIGELPEDSRLAAVFNGFGDLWELNDDDRAAVLSVADLLFIKKDTADTFGRFARAETELAGARNDLTDAYAKLAEAERIAAVQVEERNKIRHALDNVKQLHAEANREVLDLTERIESVTSRNKALEASKTVLLEITDSQFKFANEQIAEKFTLEKRMRGWRRWSIYWFCCALFYGVLLAVRAIHNS